MVKKSGVFWIIFLVLAVFLLSVCSKKNSTKPEPPDKWTILGYFDGNNEQDKDALDGDTLSYVIQHVQEMEQVGSTENVQIIVMVGSITTEGNCNYYFIEKYLDDSSDSIRSEILDSLGKKDMSDPQTLRDFIKYGVEHYPADHYMLIINDRGSGWKGVCSDQQNGDGQMMSLPELSSALFGYNFEIILFNASYMSMLEVAYQLKDKTNCLVAWQFKPPMQNILGSSEWLQGLAGDPGMSPKSLARIIVNAIYATAMVYPEAVISVSAIDLSRVDALISEIADFGSVLASHTGGHWKEVLDARETSGPLPPYYFDLKKFSKNIHESTDLDLTIKNAAQAVERATEDAVVRMQTDEPELGYGGLCIHFPLNPEDFDSTRYVQLDFAVSDWHIFLSEFIKAHVESNLGSLRIVSEPVKGALIFLDGEDTGFETDTTIHGIPAGMHAIKLAKAGWHMLQDEAREIFVEAGKTKEVLIRLFPDPHPERAYLTYPNYR